MGRSLASDMSTGEVVGEGRSRDSVEPDQRRGQPRRDDDRRLPPVRPADRPVRRRHAAPDRQAVRGRQRSGSRHSSLPDGRVLAGNGAVQRPDPLGPRPRVVAGLRLPRRRSQPDGGGVGRVHRRQTSRTGEPAPTGLLGVFSDVGRRRSRPARTGAQTRRYGSRRCHRSAPGRDYPRVREHHRAGGTGHGRAALSPSFSDTPWRRVGSGLTRKLLAFNGQVWLGGVVAARSAGAWVVAGCLLVATSCSGEQSARSTATVGTSSSTSVNSSSVAATTMAAASTTIDPTQASFNWTSEGNGRVETGSLEVPLDYDDPAAATITLAVARHRATDPELRVGSLLVNPGGPGFGGSALAEDAKRIYGPELLKRFDIIGWDPRGTGESTPCDRLRRHLRPVLRDRDRCRHARRRRRSLPAPRRVRCGLHRALGPTARPHRDRRRGTGHRRHPGRPRRGQRFPTSGSATARGSAPPGPPCSPRPCGRPCSTGRPTPRPATPKA